MYSHPERVIVSLWRNRPDEEPPRVFAILDGARESRIYPKLLDSPCERVCLYRGELAPDLAAAAPYLVALEPDAEFTHWLVENGWGDSWGIFIQSSTDLRDLRQHFRRFLMVYDPKGKPIYFRYYDPRVLRSYLPTCQRQELATVFGPVERFVCESNDPDYALEYEFRGGALRERSLELTKLV